MYQRTIIAGNLGMDPEMRYMPDGTPVTNFSVAVNSTRMVGEERVKETVWFRCSAWGKRGEAISEYFHKGKPILVEGVLKFDSNTGGPKIFSRQDGTAGSTFELNVDNWRFLPDGGGGEGGSGGGGSVRSGTPAAQEEDEIPF